MAEFEPVYFAGQQAPAPGQALELVAGVYWLRLAMPLALDHVNVWLLADGPGWTVVDTGLAVETSRASWEQVFAQQLQGRPVTRVICTHMHPDHVGLADWICERWQAPLLMTQGEYLSARLLSAELAPADADGMLAFFRGHGAEPAQFADLHERGSFYARMVRALPRSYQRIQHGQQLRIGDDAWQVIVGGGHSPEHASLWCAERELLISGDMLLPRISTNVSIYPLEPDADALCQYLESLNDFARMPPATRVLPSHGLPFCGAIERAQQLRQHHADRLALVAEACLDQSRSALELLPVLFRRQLDSHQLGFALGEAIAHANRLWHSGLLQRQRDDGGVWRFKALPTPDTASLLARARAAAGGWHLQHARLHPDLHG